MSQQEEEERERRQAEKEQQCFTVSPSAAAGGTRGKGIEHTVASSKWSQGLGCTAGTGKAEAAMRGDTRSQGEKQPTWIAQIPRSCYDKIMLENAVP